MGQHWLCSPGCLVGPVCPPWLLRAILAVLGREQWFAATVKCSSAADMVFVFPRQSHWSSSLPNSAATRGKADVASSDHTRTFTGRGQWHLKPARVRSATWNGGTTIPSPSLLVLPAMPDQGTKELTWLGMNMHREGLCHIKAAVMPHPEGWRLHQQWHPKMS